MITKIFSAIISSLLFASCFLCGNVDSGETIPERIKITADQFIISKTGKEFFNNYIKMDLNKITYINDGYLMVYNFSIPDKEGVGGEIRFSIDTLGNIIQDKEIIGIPECLSDPVQCSFNVSKEQAINIAESNGLGNGIKEWGINFKWNPVHKKYIWEIISVLSETKGNDYHRATGETMLIDPGNGDVIETSEWMIN